MKSSPRSIVFSACAGLLAGALWACRSGESEESTARAAADKSASAARAEVAAGGSRQPLKGPLAPPPWRAPVGPRLLIVPGEGVGPVRFGAHIETIERLIGVPCEDRREPEPGLLVCRYSARALEFFLRGGELKEIRVHRQGRPFSTQPKLEFGIFNGYLESGAAFGMLERGVQELLGKPKAVKKPQADNPSSTVEVHEYDGFSLEYDRVRDRVVLGGVILRAPT